MTLQFDSLVKYTSSSVMSSAVTSSTKQYIRRTSAQKQIDQEKLPHAGTNEHKKIIGYRGVFYDVTNFIKRHPGGDVIEKFLGEDATAVMDSMHKRDVTKILQACGTYQYDPDPFQKDMIDLEMKLRRDGCYDNSVTWYIWKCLCILFLFFLLLTASAFRCCDVSLVTHAVCGLMLALLWQQSGMLMHDAMHLQITRRKRKDEQIGLLFGTCLFGISARWWKDEHVVHHALTNTVDQHKVLDPQAEEICWAQNEKLFPFHQQAFSSFLVKIQTWIFIPLSVCLGRFGIIIDSFREERRLDVWIAWMIHISWICFFFSSFSSWTSIFFVYLMGCFGEGVLHIQLLINHYAKSFYDIQDREAKNHYKYMIECNLNIKCHEWFDWFHGGLNFHHEHHCFPRLPRNQLRNVSKSIKKICQRHGVYYEELGFFAALLKTLRQLHKMQLKFQDIDFRN